MVTPQELADPLLLSTWQAGRPVSPKSIGATQPGRLLRLRELIDSGLIQKTLLSTVRCEKDGERLNPVDKSRALVCPRCSTTIELSKIESLDYYSIQVNIPELAKQVVESFSSQAIPISSEGRFPSSREVTSLGITQLDGEDLEVLMARKQVSPSSLLTVWGFCATSGKFVALVHPGFSDQADSYLRLSFQACPIFPIHTTALADSKLFDAARKFPKFRRTVESRLKGVESVLFPEAESSEDIDPFAADADELSRHGGARYEPAALNLLSILGPTLKFSRRGGVRQVPDGILLLPDGLWIVDAKSASERFHYQQPQRDQVWRYLETVERRKDHFDAHFRFYGEIMVTLTESLDSSEMELARRDLRARGTSSVVSIVSHEGLQRAWARVRSSSEYWHRRITSEDPRDLLLLHRRFLSDSKINPEVKAHAESPLRIVTGEVLDSYLERVLQNPYHVVPMRSPTDVLTRLEEMFIRDYGV